MLFNDLTMYICVHEAYMAIIESKNDVYVDVYCTVFFLFSVCLQST